MKLSIRFGALAPGLHEQLTEQGFKFNFKTVDAFTRLEDFTARLYFAGLLTTKQRANVETKLVKQISKHVSTYGATKKPKK